MHGAGWHEHDGELRDALARHCRKVSAAQPKRDMLAHRAFVRAPGDLCTVGRPLLVG
ncbi:hypothetical protein [Streptomyces sp. NPDC007205]|uniref:hypothetical protein n=1 Tax=Streptomyces sp. NPDC007205 TaxID=3154316 RepID=UPI0034063B6B